MTDVGITKAKALSLMARYYNVQIKNTIAMGDGYNDVPMFEVAEYSVSMANSSRDIQDVTTYVTTKSNKNGGVAEFINKFLDEDGFRKELRAIRRKKRKIAEQTTKAH